LANWAHLGDAVIATAVLPALKEAYPDAKIGFLAASWSAAVFENHPLIDHLHVVDHWKLNRSSSPLRGKQARYREMSRRAAQEMANLRYDAAVDLYPYFPNAIRLLARARIPVRVGYASGGFGPLLTHPFSWEDRGQPVAQDHFDLLSALQVPTGDLTPALAPLARSVYDSLHAKLPLRPPFLVFHPGPPSSKKAWSTHNWRLLAQRFSHRQIFFTGHGAEEAACIDSLCAGLPHAHSACDLLSWEEWTALIAQCAQLITIDSAAAHIAAAFHTPTVVLFCGINDWRQWKPPHPSCVVATHPVPCAPCHQKRGCSSMACIRNLSVDAIRIADAEQRAPCPVGEAAVEKC
jgi:ADP-heptose:LPS heptosyltransferase